jgi:hypothetical protein
MDGDMILRESARRQALERHRLLQLAQARGDTHGRLHIATVLHVMDFVLVVDDERDAIGHGSRRRLGGLGLAPQIAQRPQPDRVVLERLHDHVGVRRRAQLAIFALEDRPHHRLRPLAVRQRVAAEAVEDQIGRIFQVRLDRQLVFGAENRPRPELLVEAQPVGIRLHHGHGIGAERGVVRQAFAEDADAVERRRLFAHALVESRADAMAAASGLGREIVEIDEVQVGCVHDRAKPCQPGPRRPRRRTGGSATAS